MAIGTLAVNLIARTGVFERKIKKSSRSLYSLQKRAAMTQQRMMGLAKGIVAVAAVGGLALMVKRTMDTIDATAKLSRRLGVATEDLIALRHAAELAGSSAETFDKSIEVMTRRLGEVKLGVGQAKYALDALGLSVGDLMKNNPAENFEIIAKAMQTLPTAADKATAAYYMMGRRGTELLNVMEDLSKKGLAGAREEAEKLGIMFSILEAEKVERANDAMTRLKQVLTGLAQTAAIEMSDGITAFATKLTELGTEGKNMGDLVVDAFERIALASVYAADGVWTIKQTASGLKALADEGVAQTHRGLKKVAPKVFTSKTGTPLFDYLENLVETPRPSEKIKAYFKLLRQGVVDAADASANSSGAVNKGFIKLLETTGKINDKLREQIELYGMSARESQLAKLAKLGEGLAGNEKESFEVLFGQSTELINQLIELDKAFEKLEAFKKLEEQAKSLTDSLKTPVEKFKEMRDVYDEMLKKELISQKIYNLAISKAGKDILGSEMRGADFEQIRTQFVSLQGLSMGGNQPQLQKMDEANKILRAIERSVSKTDNWECV